MREIDFIHAYHHRLLMSDSLREMEIIRIGLKKFAKDIDLAAHKEETKEEDTVVLGEALSLAESLITLAEEFTEKMTRLKGL